MHHLVLGLNFLAESLKDQYLALYFLIYLCDTSLSTVLKKLLVRLFPGLKTME